MKFQKISVFIPDFWESVKYRWFQGLIPTVGIAALNSLFTRGSTVCNQLNSPCLQ